MEKALERTIETLIDSGGDKWEYDSKDIQTLVQWIENKQKQVNVTLGNVSKRFCYHCEEPVKVNKAGTWIICCECGYQEEPK
tara:strand:- start:8 stop:253 length:246 start_codon:yes stop_codon:yes gene_type:complete